MFQECRTIFGWLSSVNVMTIFNLQWMLERSLVDCIWECWNSGCMCLVDSRQFSVRCFGELLRQCLRLPRLSLINSFVKSIFSRVYLRMSRWSLGEGEYLFSWVSRQSLVKHVLGLLRQSLDNVFWQSQDNLWLIIFWWIVRTIFKSVLSFVMTIFGRMCFERIKAVLCQTFC